MISIIFSTLLAITIAAWSDIDLSVAHPQIGIIYGSKTDEGLADSMATGDFNDDGMPDLLVASASISPNPGIAHIIYGKSSRITSLDLGLTTSTADVVSIYGDSGSARIGYNVGVGDFNGDGVDDAAIVRKLRSGLGDVFIIYGLKGGAKYSANIDLSKTLDPAKIVKFSTTKFSGQIYGVGAVDFDNDGVDDIAIGSPPASIPSAGVPSTGATWLVYGVKGGWGKHFVEDDPSVPMVRFYGKKNDRLGSAIARGDFNQDGKEDLVIGATGAGLPGVTNAGGVYIVYGKSERRTGLFNISTITIEEGLIITAGAGGASNYFANSISVGEFNGDGLEDLLVTGDELAYQKRLFAGSAYIIFGKQNGWDSHIDLNATLPIEVGLQISGFTYDILGNNQNGARAVPDINGDGVGEIWVSSARKETPSKEEAGFGYLIFGKKPNFGTSFIDLADDLPIEVGFKVVGASEYDRVGWSVGYIDFDQDGNYDLLISAQGLDNPLPTTNCGGVYIIYGGNYYFDNEI